MGSDSLCRNYNPGSPTTSGGLIHICLRMRPDQYHNTHVLESSGLRDHVIAGLRTFAFVHAFPRTVASPTSIFNHITPSIPPKVGIIWSSRLLALISDVLAVTVSLARGCEFRLLCSAGIKKLRKSGDPPPECRNHRNMPDSKSEQALVRSRAITHASLRYAKCNLSIFALAEICEVLSPSGRRTQLSKRESMSVRGGVRAASSQRRPCVLDEDEEY